MERKGSINGPTGQVHHPHYMDVPGVDRAWKGQLREAHLLDTAQPLHKRVVEDRYLRGVHHNGAVNGVSDLQRHVRGPLASESLIF